MVYLILFGSCSAISFGYFKHNKEVNKDCLIKSAIISSIITILLFLIRGACDILLKIIDLIFF